MRRALLIATRFPPDTGPGAIRVGCFAKYLPAFGWNVVALHPEPSRFAARDPGALRNVAVEEELAVPGFFPRQQLVHRAVTTARWMLRYQARTAGLLPLAFLQASKRAIAGLVARKSIDAIVASSPDPVALRIAAAASRSHRIPWVADFRDVLDESLDGVALELASQLERRYVGSAARIVTVSAGLQQLLATRYPRVPVEVIHNGFDPEDRVVARPPREPQRFTLVYTGSFTLRRPPDPLLSAVDALIDSGRLDPERFAIQFYGPKEHEVETLRARIKHKRVIEGHPRKPRQEILQIQAESTVLLLLAEYHVKLPGILSAKLFEYLAAGRPILSVPEYASIDAVLADTGAGQAFTTREALIGYLGDAFAAWSRDGALPYHGRPAAIERYSRREQAGALARALDAAVEDLRSRTTGRREVEE